jgi:hypothetical protein
VPIRKLVVGVQAVFCDEGFSIFFIVRVILVQLYALGFFSVVNIKYSHEVI